MRKFKNLLVELLAAFILVSGILVINPQPIYAIEAESVQVSGIAEGGYVFTSEEIKPVPVVKDSTGTTTYTKDDDYEVFYPSSDYTEVGTKEIKIVGKSGTLAGVTKTTTFKITPASLSANCISQTITYAGGQTVFEWPNNDQPVEPEVTQVSVLLSDQNGKYSTYTLNSNEYTVSYGENKTIGKTSGSVTITGQNNFKDSYTFNFEIDKRQAVIDSDAQKSTGLVYNGRPQSLLSSAAIINAADRDCIDLYYGTAPTSTALIDPNSQTKDYSKVVGTEAKTYYVHQKVTPSSQLCGYLEADKYLGEVVIAPAQYDVTTPKVNSLTYNGKSQVLTHFEANEVAVKLDTNEEKGATVIPSMEYTTTSGENVAPTNANVWQVQPIEAKDAGDYYIWYRVVAADTNHVSVQPTYLGKAVIGSAQPTITVQNKTVDYSATSVNIDAATVTLVNGEKYQGSITYTYYLDQTHKTVAENHTDAGIYYVVASIPTTKNYLAASSQHAVLTINKIGSSISTHPTGKNIDEQGKAHLDYTGVSQPLITAGIVTGGDIYYAVTDQTVEVAPTNGVEWNTAIPNRTIVNKNGYRVWYKVIGDKNHNDITPAYIDVCIDKGVVSVPTINAKTFNGDLQKSGLVTNDLYTVTIDDGGTDVGTYKVTLTLQDYHNYIWNGDDNYKAFNTDPTPNYTKEISYDINKLDLSTSTITLNQTQFEYTGSQIKPIVTEVKVGNLTIDSSGYTVSYEENINISKTGATPAESNQPKVIVTANENSNYTGTKSYNFEIVRRHINSEGVTFAIPNEKYLWENEFITPEVTVKDGERTLVKGTDYTVSYDNNKNVTKQAKITITGINNYDLTKEIYFEIEKLALDSEGVVVTWDLADKTYTGFDIKPTVTISYKSGETTKTLTAGSDFNIGYSNNLNVTTAENPAVINITLTNPNTTQESDSRTFKIVPQNITGSSTVTTTVTGNPYIWNDLPHEATVQVVDSARSNQDKTKDQSMLIAGTDYEITSYENNEDASSSAKVTVAGRGNYTGTQTVLFTIEKYKIQDTDIVLEYNEKTFDRVAYTPNVRIYIHATDRTFELTKDTDFYVEYDKNTNVGQADVKISLNNTNCEFVNSDSAETPNVKTVHFTINPKDLTYAATYATGDGVSNYKWCGNPIAPVFIIKDGDVTLTKNVDYTLSAYNTNSAVGTYNVTATFINNYKGSITLTYTIDKLNVKKDIFVYEKGEKVSYDSASDSTTLEAEVFNGTDITKNIKLYYESAVHISNNRVVYGTEVEITNKFTTEYTNNHNAGNASIAITFDSDALNGNIAETNYVRNLSFTINPKNITHTNKDFVSITRTDEETVSDYVWTGDAYEPTIIVKDLDIKTGGNPTVITTDDYDVTYSNNENASTNATITVTGKRNYTGTANKKFTIRPVGFDDLTFSKTDVTSLIYNEAAHTVTPALTYNDSTRVLDTSLYTYTITDNVNASNIAKVNITLTGDNTTKRTKTYNFTIAQKSISNLSTLTIETADGKSSYRWCGSQVKPNVVVKDGNKTLVEGTDYEVSYANNVDVTVEGAEESEKPTITVTGKASGNYKDSASITFTIVKEPVVDNNTSNILVKDLNKDNPGDPADLSTLTAATFTGSAITRNFELYHYSKTEKTSTGIKYTDLVKVDPSQYDVAYSANTNAGEATITVTFKSTSNITGTKTLKFAINPKSITKVDDDVVTVSGIESTYGWKGAEWKPTVTVKDISRDVDLEEGTSKDFTVTYAHNTDVSTSAQKATVTIMGTGNYTGTVVKEFTIRKITLADVNLYEVGPNGGLILVGADNLLGDRTYTGSVIKPQLVLKLKDNSDKILVSGTDYTVDYPNDNINYTGGSATADITVKLINTTYTDTASSKTLLFKIEQKDITDNSDITIVTNEESYPYINAAITPTFKVKDGTKELTLNTDYESVVITQTVNNEPGKGGISVTGKGNYKGTATGEFVVRKLKFGDIDVRYKNANNEWVSSYIDDGVNYLGDFVYNGKEVRPEISIVSKVANNNFNNISLGDSTTGDYDLVWSENRTNVSDDSYVTIHLKGAHFEDTSLKFVINITPRSIENAEYTLVDPTCGLKYNGKEIKPTPANVKVKVDDTNTLILSSSDYDISYTNNIEISDLNNHPTITLTGKGNYKDSKSKQFDIADILIQVSQEVDGDLLVYSDNEYYINSLTESKTENNPAKIEMTVGDKTHTYFNNNVKNDLTKVDSKHLIIPYSTFVADNKDLMKDTNSLGAILTVTTSSTATGSLVSYNSVRSFSNIQTIRGIEIINIKEKLEALGDTSTSIYLDGQKLIGNQVTIYDGAQRIVQTYTYNNSLENLDGDIHKQYANGMRVYTIDQDNTGHAVVNELTGFANAFRYDGTAIRLVDPKGARFFTTINKATKNQLVTGVNGYKLIEMGSIIAADNDLAGIDPYLIQDTSGDFLRPSNIKIGKAIQTLDGPYYSDNGTTLRYSTVLNIGQTSIQFEKDDDLAVRSYMVLRPINCVDSSKDIIIYTGTIHRSISYVASQALPDYIGTSSEAYIRSLIQTN